LRIGELLQQHRDYKIQVQGHTDYVGSVAYNEKLALARANTVRDFLLKYGAAANQIAVSGQGKRTPEVPNTTKEGRFINRRVVMTVTDANGKIIAAGTGPEVVTSLDDRLKKLEDCCSAILKKLDKLDDILAAIRDLKNENNDLKSRLGALENQEKVTAGKVDETATTLAGKPSTQQVANIAKGETDRVLKEQIARNQKFSLLALNAGPTMAGELSFSGKGRFFSPFGGTG